MTNRLYVTAAESGTLTPTGNGDEFVITLNKVSNVAWFTDRPQHETGENTMAEFVEVLWPLVYGQVAPNAVIKFYVSGANEGVFVTLKKAPEYDSGTGILKFQATLLNFTFDEKPDSLLEFEIPVITVLNNVSGEDSGSSFVIYGENASLDVTAAEGQYTLTQNDLDNKVLLANNAPGRYSRVSTTDSFVEQWSSRFGDSPPNAVIFGFTDSGELDGYFLTLSDPKYEQEVNRMTYSATVLGQETETIAQLRSATLIIDSSSGVEEIPDICNSTGGRTLLVSNNCGAKSVACTDKKSVHVSSNAIQFEPACLQNLCAGSPPVTVNLPEGNNYAFWVGEYGSSTLCEVEIGKDGTWDAYNLSFNQGFDIGMTLVAPEGMVVPKIVAKTSKAYSAYPLRTTLPGCWAAPCTQPNYSHPPIPGGTYHLFLCNQPDEEASTPGSYGCALNECPPGGVMSKCPDWTTLPCQGTPKLTGVGDCYESCPGT